MILLVFRYIDWSLVTQSTAMFFPTFWNIDSEIGRLRKFIAKNPCFRIKAMFAMVQSFLGMLYNGIFLTLFRMGFFGAVQGWGAKCPLSKICDTYPTIMKLGTIIPYLKNTLKIYESRDTPLEFCWRQHFFTRNQKILLYQEI